MKNFALSLAKVEKHFPSAASEWRVLLHPTSRTAILGHASTRELLPPIAALLLFAALLLPISFAIFSWALRRTKITGTLTHF